MSVKRVMYPVYPQENACSVSQSGPVPPVIRPSLSELPKSCLSKPLGEGGDLRLTAALTGKHPAQIVQAIDELTKPEALAVFNWLDNERAAEVLDELDPETVRFLTDNAPLGRIAILLDHLPMDDAAEVRRLLAYPEDSVGRLMTDKFAVVDHRMPAGHALDYVRRAADGLETINEIYVIGDDKKLHGMVTLRSILIAQSNRPVQEFIEGEVVSISPTVDQQEAARMISRYDLLTLPVTDGAGHILGIVTIDDMIDDMIDVLVEEFNKDYLRAVGSDAQEMERKSPIQIAKLRLPWIMATLFIELLAGFVIRFFDTTLTKFILLASFMPIISAISGNTGLQSAAIIIRGLSSGQVQLSHWRQALARQMMTTALFGTACAVTLSIIGAIWDRHWAFGLVVFLGMFVSVTIAGVVGTCRPAHL